MTNTIPNQTLPFEGWAFEIVSFAFERRGGVGMVFFTR